MESLVNGMIFLLERCRQTSFSFREKDGKTPQSEADQAVFPRLLVSIGSGVSILKVNSRDSFERVSGTMIGGGTLMGLGNLLLGVNDFEEIRSLSQKGNLANVDMLVNDIYGDKAPQMEGIPGEVVASSFGKVASDNPFILHPE